MALRDPCTATQHRVALHVQQVSQAADGSRRQDVISLGKTLAPMHMTVRRLTGVGKIYRVEKRCQGTGKQG